MNQLTQARQNSHLARAARKAALLKVLFAHYQQPPVQAAGRAKLKALLDEGEALGLSHTLTWRWAWQTWERANGI